MRRIQQRVEILKRAEQRVYVGIIRDVIAHIRHRAFEDGRQPYRIHTQIGQIGQAAGDPLQVTDPVPVAILKRPGIDLIGY